MKHYMQKKIIHTKAAKALLTGSLALSLAIGFGSTADNSTAAGSLQHICTISTAEAAKTQRKPLVIAEQGIFSAGGTMIHSEGTFDIANYYTSRSGSTSHVDHANVLYQIPASEKGLPMVFLHGYGQSRMGWMTTPDGRDGWSDMFLRMGHSIFLIDQPRRGEAGQTSVAGTISTVPADQTWYTQFRIGTYRDNQFTYNKNSQFPQGEKELDQFFRQMTPDTAMDSVHGDQSIDNADTFTADYNAAGGSSTIVSLPDEGIYGNDHMLFQDMNNDVIAEHVESWLAKNAHN